MADQALNLLNVDACGFDHMDRRLLLTLIEKFSGGPVGVDSLAAAISEERDTIEDVEPHLSSRAISCAHPEAARQRLWRMPILIA